MRLFLLLLLCLASASCVSIHRVPGVVIASDPPGARILLDGKDSGYVTPCDLGVDRDTRRIDLVLDGYQTATRSVEDDSRWWLIFWNEAYLNPNTWRFPLWLGFEDFVAPIKLDRGYWPQRVYVKMKLAGAE